MATLFEFTEAAQFLYELLQAEEIDEQTFTDTLEAMGVEEKLEAYCQIIGQLNADIEMFKTEAARIAARKKTAENSVERMKQAILIYLKQSGQTKSKAGTFSVALSTSKSVQVTDESKIPPQYLVIQPPKVDKIAIREALNKGDTVEGAELVEKEGVRIR
jgi:hypothetical protein